MKRLILAVALCLVAQGAWACVMDSPQCPACPAGISGTDCYNPDVVHLFGSAPLQAVPDIHIDVSPSHHLSAASYVCLDYAYPGEDPRCVALRSEIAADQAARSSTWHLLTQSYGGTVSLNHNLTKDQCEYAKHRALNEPATPDDLAVVEHEYKIVLQHWRDSAIKANAWALLHPQCKHLMWDGYGPEGPPPAAVHELKDGWCSIEGNNGPVRDAADKPENEQPETDADYEKAMREEALTKSGFGKTDKPGDIKSAECFQ